MSTKQTIEAALGRRVYEYVDTNGIVYYSFTKHEATLSNPIRLRLKSKIGVHLVNFLVKLRQAGKALGLSEEDVG